MHNRCGLVRSFAPGNVCMLGDCQLDGLPVQQQDHTFMTNLTAMGGLPCSSMPGTNGLFGLTLWNPGVEPMAIHPP
jgi:hypothetical protein